MREAEDHFKFLRSVYFFASLKDDEVRTLLEVCREERFGAGGVVFAEGAEADKFYIVLEGTLQVWKGRGTPAAELLAEHGRGHLFGEMALVDDLPRSAAIVARTPARLLSIQKVDFQRIVASNAGIALSVLRSLSSMVRKGNDTYVQALQRRNAELERLYEDLKHTQSELIRNDRLAAVGRFASLILHDIRNPLSIARAYAELILHDTDNRDRVGDSARVIVKEADRLSAMVNELLDFARGETRLSLGPVSIPTLVAELLQGLEQRFAKARIAVRTEVSFEGPVIMDERRMLRVLHNLTDNAVKAMPHGGVYSLAVRAEAESYSIQIGDTGVGMTPETMKRLFEPFFSSFQGGTGLGMAIARSIVRAHGGELSVESEPDKGTRLTVTLPRKFYKHEGRSVVATHPDFDRLQSRRIDEIDAELTLFEHRATGARLLSVRNADDNKVFGVTFPTPAEDSTGVAHIMEHSVLAGSERYPVKEPFVELVKSSLNTFLNAMTYPDRTCYPVASQNLKDLRNLIDVYMDAVLHPLIPPRLLAQEGWHYELTPGAAGADPLLGLKGVVYNEMKGVYSNPEAILGRKSLSSLFPDTIYGHDSGGDPQRIPDLTYERFKAFHGRFYHPTNALVYFSGDDEVGARLDLVARWFGGYTRLSRAPSPRLQPRWSGARVVKERYSAGDNPATAKSMLTVNWLLHDHTEPERSLALNILSEVLLGSSASPLRRALIESGLGEGLVASGLDDDIREATFSAGLKGIAASDAARVEELIRETLAGLAKKGIDPDTVAAAMNTVEFALRENNTGSYPRGLVMMLRSIPSWMYLDDPFLPLAFEAPLRSLKQKLERGERPFEELIRSELVENGHSSVVLLEPDPSLGERRDREERERLAALRGRLGPAELETIRVRQEELELFQKSPDPPEALARIPSLQLEDLDRQTRKIPIEIVPGDGWRLIVHEIPTSGVVYVDVGFELHAVDTELLPLLPLLSRSFTEMGTAKSDYVRLQQRIGRDTGGIGASLMISPVVGAAGSSSWLFLRGKCLRGQLDTLLELMEEILRSVRLDDKGRFLQLVRESKARTESSVVPSGHSVVASRLAAKFDEASWLREQVGGVDFLFYVRELATKVEPQWEAVRESLQGLLERVVSRRLALCNLTVSSADRSAVEKRVAAFMGRLPDRPHPRAVWKPDWRRYDEGLTAPSQVNFAGKGGNLYELGYRLHGSVFAVLKYLRTTWIWERVRVQGGAYGGMVQFDPISGFLGYLSYRDPNLLKTLETYDATADFLSKNEIDPDELRKSVIGAVGEMDPCLLPDAQGYTSLRRYLVGLTEAERQRLRDELLATRAEHFRSFGAELRKIAERGYVVALGSPERVREANAALGEKLRLTALL